MTAIHIDGSQGEGGGQIVRSSLALSLVTGKPVSIENIRAGRKKPGLMRQHLTALNAAIEISSATATGNDIGSCSLQFEPGSVQAGVYKFSVGTAGSATLVLQTVLPSLLLANGSSRLVLEGGTHNQWAPPFDFLQKAFLPLINRMGPKVTATLERHGFYPAGGGRFVVEIEPAPHLTGFDLLERGKDAGRHVTALLSNLPKRIGEREVAKVLRRMNWSAKNGTVHEVTAHGPGNVVFIQIESEHVTEVFAAFGRMGVKAEHVAKEAIKEATSYMKSKVPVGAYLADQIVLPLGISAWQDNAKTQRGGTFCTLPLTRHTITHINILKQFLDVRIDIVKDEEENTQVVIAS